MTAKSNNGPDRASESEDFAQRLIRHIQGPGTAAAARKLGRRLLLTHLRERGIERIELGVKRGAPSWLSFRRNRDGTLDFRVEGQPEPLKSASEIIREAGDRLKRRMKAEIATSAVRSVRPASRTAGLLNPAQHVDGRDVGTALHRAVEEAITQAWSGCRIQLSQTASNSDNRRRLPGTLEEARAYAETAIESSMAPVDTAEAMQAYFGKASSRYGGPTLPHNTVILNREILKQLHESSPNVLQLYCCAVAPQETEAQRLSHPGEVVSAVRDLLQLPNAGWQVFCQALRWDIGKGGLRPEARDETVHRIRTACLAVAGANAPGAKPQRVQDVLRMEQEHRYYRETHWECGDPWQAWTKLLNRYMRQPDGDAWPEELKYISDALQDHVAEGLTWGEGNYETLLNRAARWHREIARIEQQRNGGELHWDSATGKLKIGGITFTPSTTSAGLILLGRKMGNCVGTYAARCAAGDCRIFAAQRQGRTIDTVELLRSHSGVWSLGQVESTNRRRPLPGIEEAAKELAEQYNRATRLANARGKPEATD